MDIKGAVTWCIALVLFVSIILLTSQVENPHLFISTFAYNLTSKLTNGDSNVSEAPGCRRRAQKLIDCFQKSGSWEYPNITTQEIWTSDGRCALRSNQTVK